MKSEDWIMDTLRHQTANGYEAWVGKLYKKARSEWSPLQSLDFPKRLGQQGSSIWPTDPEKERKEKIVEVFVGPSMAISMQLSGHCTAVEGIEWIGMDKYGQVWTSMDKYGY